MQDYIAAHISEEISLTELAEAAHFSPWYSARIFKEMTGISPADYIRRYKLSKSVLRLRDEYGCDVWGILTSIKSIGGEPVCLWLPAKYLMFQGEPFEEDYCEAIEAVQSAIDKYNPSMSGCRCDFEELGGAVAERYQRANHTIFCLG